MKTIIKLTKSGTTSYFYFINVYMQDTLGFINAQSAYMISEEQYLEMKGNKEEKFANGLYYVDFI